MTLRALPLPPRRSHAFTLVELLSVIVIIAVLAALIFPIIGKMREKGDQAKCVGNLRNIYAGARLWSADNNGDVLPAFLRTDGDTAHWNRILLPYFSLADNTLAKKYACPAYYKDGEMDTAWDWGYGINQAVRAEGAGGPNSNRNFSTRVTTENGVVTNGEFVRWSTISHPQNRAMLLESSDWHVNYTNVQNFAVFNRHGSEKCTVIFYDGHVGLLAPNGVLTSVQDPENFKDEVDAAVN